MVFHNDRDDNSRSGTGVPSVSAASPRRAQPLSVGRPLRIRTLDCGIEPQPSVTAGTLLCRNARMGGTDEAALSVARANVNGIPTRASRNGSTVSPADHMVSTEQRDACATTAMPPGRSATIWVILLVFR